MRILVIRPGEKPKVQEIDGSLESMQEVVGGTIQALYPFADLVALVANDDGKLLGLSANRALRDEDGNVYDIVCGTFFVCGLSEEDFASLTDEQVRYFTEYFAIPEMFVKMNGNLIILPIV